MNLLCSLEWALGSQRPQWRSDSFAVTALEPPASATRCNGGLFCVEDRVSGGKAQGRGLPSV